MNSQDDPGDDGTQRRKFRETMNAPQERSGALQPAFPRREEDNPQAVLADLPRAALAPPLDVSLRESRRRTVTQEFMSKAKDLFGLGDKDEQPPVEFSIETQQPVKLMSPLKFKMSFSLA
jgi:hypothetical protein